MPDDDLPRIGGAHRRSRGGQRLASLLAGLVGVAIVAVLVVLVLHKRGEPASHTAGSANSTPTASRASRSSSPSAGPTSALVSATPAAGSSSVASTPAPTPQTTPSTAAPLPALDVLNDSRIKGLAASAATRLRAAGWIVARTGNFKSADDVPQTTVFYPDGEKAAALRLAAAFRIDRVLAASSGLSATHLTVVLARDWASRG